MKGLDMGKRSKRRSTARPQRKQAEKLLLTGMAEHFGCGGFFLVSVNTSMQCDYCECDRCGRMPSEDEVAFAVGKMIDASQP